MSNSSARSNTSGSRLAAPIQEDQAVARPNRDFPDLAVFHRHTKVALYWAVETQHLLHRRVDFPGLFAQALKLEPDA